MSPFAIDRKGQGFRTLQTKAAAGNDGRYDRSGSVGTVNGKCGPATGIQVADQDVYGIQGMGSREDIDDR